MEVKEEYMEGAGRNRPNHMLVLGYEPRVLKE